MIEFLNIQSAFGHYKRLLGGNGPVETRAKYDDDRLYVEHYHAYTGQFIIGAVFKKNGQLLKAFFRTADRGFESRSSSEASRRQRVGQRNQVVERHPPRQEIETGAGGRWRGLEPRQPSHPALRSPSTKWAWSSGRNHGTRLRIYMSNAAGARETALSSASFASAVRPS